MEQSKPIPEEIQEFMRVNSPIDDPDCYFWLKGAEATYHRMAEEVEALKAERDAYRQALENIASPIEYLRKEAEKVGGVLNGMAFEVIKSPEFFKQIAQPALEQYSSHKNHTENG